MSDYSELKRLAEAATPADDSPHLPCTVAFDRAASPAVVLELIGRLEVSESMEGLYTSTVTVERAELEQTKRERDQLKAESEALRDDLDQAKYDADAWRNREESVWIQVFLGDGDDPFISAIHGAICIEQISLMQADLKEYAEDYFEKGPGFYVFECRHFEAHYDNVGMTEPAHWEMDFNEYARFPWADEQDAAMSKEPGQ